MKKIKEVLLITVVSLMATAWLAGILKLSNTLGSQKDFWDILTALGTCAAAVVALFFGLGQQVQSRREAITRAQIVAARLVPMLASRIDAVVLLRIQVQTFLESYGKIAGVRPAGNPNIRATTERVLFDVSTSDLTILAVLPNNCATRLARAIALIEMVVQDIVGTQTKSSLFDRSAMDAQAFAIRTIPWIEECETLLKSVFETCISASREVSPDANEQLNAA